MGNAYNSYLVKVSYNVDDPTIISIGCVWTARLPTKVASDTVPKARAQKPTMRRSDMIKDRREQEALMR